MYEEWLPIPQVAHPPPISTPSGAGQLQQNGSGSSPGVVSTPGTAPSPTVDSVLHSIWVDIIDREDLRFGRRLGECTWLMWLPQVSPSKQACSLCKLCCSAAASRRYIGRNAQVLPK